MELPKIVENLGIQKSEVYIFPEVALFNKSSFPEIPEWTCDPSISDIGIDEFTLTFPNVQPSKPGYSLMQNYKYKVIDVLNWNHDFTFECLSINLDQKISETFGKRNEPSDNYTPDVIIKRKDDVYFVIEFTTCRNSSVESLKKAFQKKRVAYEECLMDRATKKNPIVFCIIVVSRDKVYTNLTTLTQLEIEELCFRYLIALDVRLYLEKINVLESETREEKSQKIRKLEHILKNIKITESGLKKYEPFSMEFYESISGDSPDREYLTDTINYIIDKSKTKVDNSLKTFLTKDDIKHISDIRKRDKSSKLIYLDENCRYKGPIPESYSRHVKAEVEKYKNEGRLGERKSNFDSKAILLFPGVFTEPLNECTSKLGDSLCYLGPRLDNSTFRLWESLSFKGVFCNYVDEEETGEEIVERLSNVSDKNKDKKVHFRRKYRRIMIPEVDESDLINIAKLGVGGKKYSKQQNKEVLDYRKMKSLPFSIDAKIDDIDSFLDDYQKWFVEFGKMPEYQRYTMGGIRESSLLHRNPGSTKVLHSQVENLLMTRLGMLCSFISEVGTELCISLKQHTKNNEFILKKIKGRKTFLLIKPTKTSESIFFSIGWFNKDQMGQNSSSVFKKVFSNGVFSFTEFVSLDAGKLTNWVKAESNFISWYAFWSEFYCLPTWDNQKIIKTHPNILKMVLLSFLISLHDKKCVEEPITLSRYIGMEGFVNMPSLPEPQKILKKFPTFYKSRLEVWIIKKMLGFVEYIGEGNFFCEKTIDSRDTGLDIKKWFNLTNPFLNTPLTTPDQVINLFYLGYLTNKEQKQHTNTIGKLFTKILEWEDNKPVDYNHLGLKDPKPADINKHEFSVSFIKRAVEVAKDNFKKTLGSEWEKNLEDDILSTLVHLDIEEFSTLKASSNFDNKWYNFVSTVDYERMLKGQDLTDSQIPSLIRGRILALSTHLSQEERRIEVDRILEENNFALTRNYHRSKVIQNLNNIRGDKVDMFELIPDALKHCDENECLNVDIFQKVQYGLREIYVLGIHERVLQLIIERISRVICSKFESETMTHPRNKFNIPSKHVRASTTAFGKDFVTMTTADDAEKWNQGHFVTKFAIMLCSLLPKKFHGFIINTLKLWMHKRIMLDPKLLEHFHNMRSDKIYDEGVKLLLDCVKGKEKRAWHKSGSTYIETQSGMMQGILHYTSSLYHTIVLNYLKSIIHNLHKRSDLLYSEEVVVSHMQSSDDSALLISGRTSDKNELAKFLRFSRLCFYIKDELSLMFGIYRSVKSTSHLMNLLEFNSEFFVGGNLYRPTLRWVSASLSISEQECLASRQEDFSNLLTNVLEGGGCINTCSLIQWAQALLHYRMLGSSVSPIYSYYISSACESRDPALGYFLMDHPLTSGLMGFTYNLWNAVLSSDLGRKYKFYISKLHSSEEKIEEKRSKLYTLENTRSGVFLHSTMIGWGNRKKWDRLINDVGVPENWIEQTDQNPEVLYRRARTSNELTLKLSAKLFSPGVSESLGKGNIVPRVISSSVYVLTEDVLTQNRGWFDSNWDHKDKYSLYLALLEEHELLHGVIGDLNDEDMSNLFPSHIEYLNTRSILNSVSNFSYSSVHVRENKNKVSIQIFDTEYHQVMKAESLIMWKWFGIDNLGASDRVKEHYWASLKNTYTWLMNDPHETLKHKHCPFTHQIQLRNFFSRLDKSNRIVHLTGSPIYSQHGKAFFLSVLLNDYFPGIRILSESECGEVKVDDCTSLLHFLKMISVGPYSENYRSILTHEFLKKWGNLIINHKGRSRKSILSIFQAFCKMTKTHDQIVHNIKDKEAIFEMIKRQKLGVIGYFFKRQKYDLKNKRYKGKGVWIGLLDGVEVEIHMDSNQNGDSILTAVILKELTQLSQTLSLLKTLCKDIGVKNVRLTDGIYPSINRHFKRVETIEGFNIVNKVSSRLPYIYQNASMKSSIDILKSSIMMESFNGILRLMLVDGGVRSTILSLSLKNSDVNMHVDKRILEQNKIKIGHPSLEWLTMRNLNLRTLIDWLEHCTNIDDSAFGPITKDYDYFFKPLLQGTLMRVLGNTFISNDGFFFQPLRETHEDLPEINEMGKDIKQIPLTENDLNTTINWGDDEEEESNLEDSQFSSDSEGLDDLIGDVDLDEDTLKIYRIEAESKESDDSNDCNDLFSNLQDMVGFTLDNNLDSDAFAHVQKEPENPLVFNFHPFLDDLIQKLIELGNKTHMEALLKNNVYIEPYERLLPIISIIKNIPISEFQTYKEYTENRMTVRDFVKETDFS